MAGDVQAGWLGVTRGHFQFPEFICPKSVVTGNQKIISYHVGMRMKLKWGGEALVVLGQVSLALRSLQLLFF